MFQISYSEVATEPSEKSEDATRMEIDLESLENWVIRNSGDGEPFRISPKDMILLVREAIWWRDQTLELQDELAKAQDMVEDALKIANSNAKAAQDALGLVR